MMTVSVEEMQRDVATYLRLVQVGETIVITQQGQPVAEVKPVARPAEELRPYGLCKGEFVVPDDFDAPLPEEILASFEGR